MDIDIEIGELTPCLKNALSNEIVNTHYEECCQRILQNAFKEWKFDWSLPQQNGYKIFQLFVVGEPEIQGQIAFKINNNSVHVELVETAPHNYGRNGKYIGVGGHLFAIACKYSFENGCEGYVDFMSKTNLMKYYHDELGAKYAAGQNMYLDTNAARKLINKYLDKEN